MLSSLALVLALGLTPQHWTAYSQTAMSITGDVTFSPTQMTFSNRTSIGLALAKHTAQYDLYRVRGTANPRLLRGNTLCGPKAPGYLAVARNGHDVNVSFFWPGVPPSGLNAASLCATYMYGSK